MFTTLNTLNSVLSWSDELLTGVLETLTSTSGVRENRALMRDDLPTLLLPIKHTWKTPTGSQLQICVPVIYCSVIFILESFSSSSCHQIASVAMWHTCQVDTVIEL